LKGFGGKELGRFGDGLPIKAFLFGGDLPDFLVGLANGFGLTQVEEFPQD